MVYVAERKRDLFPDQLRGFALLGIALVNIAYFSTGTFSGASGDSIANPLNASVAFLVLAFAQAKFYLLFSFLFGYSAHYVIGNSKANIGRFRARAFGLIVFGFIHAVLFFHGDILFAYGILALLLLAFYFRRESTLKIWCSLIFIGTAVLFTGLSLLLWAAEIFGIEQQQVFSEGFDQALISGSFAEAAQARLLAWPEFFLNVFLVQGPLVLMAFLIGAIAARKDLLSAEGMTASLAKKLLVLGFGVGLPFQLLSAWIFVNNEQSVNYSEATYLGSVTINFITAPLLAAGYIGLLWLVTKTKPGALNLFASAGRLSLTVYLSQSIIFSLIFSGYGLGLFGELDYWLTVLIAISVYFLLAVASVFYLRKFNMGPFEKLLNLWTRGFSRAANG